MWKGKHVHKYTSRQVYKREVFTYLRVYLSTLYPVIS
jgi:hypothetical protein